MHAGNAAVVVFCLICLLVAVIGVGRREPGSESTSLEEWGLGGRRFGAFLSWCLIGGDFYTAYTIIAVPSLVFASGADGFFALPFTILVYPLVFLLMPRLWSICKVHHLVTTADFARFRYGSPTLELCVALTGILALLPYIALQLLGMEVAIGMAWPATSSTLSHALPLAAAFLVLATFTFTSGLKAPARLAFLKDAMIYLVVIAAIWLIPQRLGGYARIFTNAGAVFANRSGSLILPQGHFASYATLALGSAMAAFMYPHTVTSVLSARDRKAIQRNAVLLPAYTVLLGMLALTGLMAVAAHVQVRDSKLAVPVLLGEFLPPWAVGFCGAAIMVAALVPASIMAIAAANLFTRNVLPKLRTAPDPAHDTRTARWSALFVLICALGLVFVLPVTFAIDLQLLGGIWILQTFPTIALGLWQTRFNAFGLLCGWLVSVPLASWMALRGGAVHTTVVLTLAGRHCSVYLGLVALALNLVISGAGSLLTPAPAGVPVLQPGDFAA